MYESPIDIIYSEMQTKLEGEVFKAVQNVGINVNKDELIKALSYDRQQYEKGYADAKAEQQWIPVTERLPKKYIGEWLCCDKYGNIFILRYENTTPNRDCVFCYTDNDGYSVSVHDVVAWMPLPMPWEGEGSE